MPSDENLPLTQWSVTITARVGNVPTGHLARAHTYTQMYGERGAFSLESGPRGGRLHVQGILEIRAMTDSAGAQVLRNHFKSFIPINHGDAVQLVVKPLLEGQTFVHMLGYVQKDAGKVSPRFHSCTLVQGSILLERPSQGCH